MLTSSLLLILGKVGVAVAGAVVSVVAAPAILSAFGFGAAGVAAGTVAAAVHSAIGNVAAGGLFAAMQSAGAAGIGAGIQAALATIGGGIGALFGFLF